MTHLALLTMIVLILAIAAPVIGEPIRRSMRAREAHASKTRHCYTNFNEKLEYEPVHDHDIQKVPEPDLIAKGYKPSGVTHRIPRTFRAKVPGDHTIELWTASSPEEPPLWICCR